MPYPNLPSPPYELWDQHTTGSRLFGRGLHRDAEIGGSFRLVPTGKLAGGIPPSFSVPLPLWQLAGLPEADLAWVEGALVHAQLLSRQGVASGVELAGFKVADTPSQADLAKTIAGIRGRIWAIKLSPETQNKILRLILDILDKVEDPLARASIAFSVFNYKLSTVNKGVPEKSLGVLTMAMEKIAAAQAWVEHARAPDQASYYGAYNRAIRQMTPAFMAHCGAPTKAMKLAREIDQGFDLIILAATVRWLRMLEGKEGFFVSEDGWNYAVGRGLEGMKSLTKLYGIEELRDPSCHRANERCLATAITRLTMYKKNLLKRADKLTQG